MNKCLNIMFNGVVDFFYFFPEKTKLTLSLRSTFATAAVSCLAWIVHPNMNGKLIPELGKRFSDAGDVDVNFNNSGDFDVAYHQDPFVKDADKLFPEVGAQHWLKEFCKQGVDYFEQRKPPVKIVCEDDEAVA